MNPGGRKIVQFSAKWQSGSILPIDRLTCARKGIKGDSPATLPLLGKNEDKTATGANFQHDRHSARLLSFLSQRGELVIRTYERRSRTRAAMKLASMGLATVHRTERGHLRLTIR